MKVSLAPFIAACIVLLAGLATAAEDGEGASSNLRGADGERYLATYRHSLKEPKPPKGVGGASDICQPKLKKMLYYTGIHRNQIKGNGDVMKLCTSSTFNTQVEIDCYWNVAELEMTLITPEKTPYVSRVWRGQQKYYTQYGHGMGVKGGWKPPNGFYDYEVMIKGKDGMENKWIYRNIEVKDRGDC